MRKPYVGITGFMDKSEVLSVLGVLPPNSPRLLMVGVLASQKTIFRRQKNKWPNRYPEPENISSIFPRHPLVLNLVHYNTKEPETLLEQMVEVTNLGGDNFHGFQLNVKWPPTSVLARYINSYPDKLIVLQVGAGAFEAINNSPDALARKITREYIGFIDYLFLDPSGGYGKSFGTERAREFLEALRGRGVEEFIGLGVAGGLSPATMDLIEPLAKDFPDLCIDAQGLLRSGDDNLILEAAREYLSKALQIFSA